MIRFAVSEATDVEVAIVDGTGTVIRHLTAGMLGKTAPAPLAKDSLKQALAWDGADDAGKPVAAGTCKVRVRIGSRVALDRYLGENGQATSESLCSVAVGPAGELFILSSSPTYGRSELRVMDKGGKYLRTIMPYPANTPEFRLKSIGRLQVGDEAVPVVFSAHSHSVQPLVEGMTPQGMVIHPKGYLVLASAVGTIANHGPPRYLLAMDFRGGAPEGVNYIGPQFLTPRGMLGGAGERGAASYDGIAVSPDGQWFYLSTSIEGGHFKAFRKHCVWRVKWTDAAVGEPLLGKAEAGQDDAHFSDPQGIATDAAGNLYVCDRGNNRVMVFDATAKLLGKFAVDQPQQIAVHPKTGEIYVVSRPPGQSSKIAGTALLKFSAFKDGTATQQIKLDLPKKVIESFAVDATASSPRLWAAVTLGWRNANVLPISEKDGAFELGKGILDSNVGLRYPMFVHADEPRNRLYVTENQGGVSAVDLKTGEVSPVKAASKANEVVPDRDGNMLMMQGWAIILSRTDSSGKPVNFASGAKLGPWPLPGKQEEDTWARSKGPQVGDRGYVVAPNGDIYVILMSQYGLGRLDVYANDGTLKKQGLIENIPHGSSGLAVDAAGNIYLGVNIRPTQGPLFPFGFSAVVPENGWVWWKAKREGIWSYPYYNTYLYHWGSVMKFSPKGGRFYIWGGRIAATRPDVPADATEYRNGYLNISIAVQGSQGLFPGCGPIPTNGLNWGDPSCTCNNSRLAVDGFGRVFMPDVFRFSVEMVDTAGNAIARIGRYGNADSKSAAGTDPAFVWPAFVSVADDDVFVSDSVNRRIAQMKVKYAESAECPLP